MGPTIDVGLAVTSHRDGPLATATFDHVNVGPVSPVATGLATGGGSR